MKSSSVVAALVSLVASACVMVGTELGPEQIANAPSSRGLVVFGVDAPREIDFVELCSDAGCISAGPFTSPWTVRVLSLDRGRYCVSRISSFWRKSNDDFACFQVSADAIVYPGHLTMRRRSAPDEASSQWQVGYVPHTDINTTLAERFPGLQVPTPAPDHEPAQPKSSIVLAQPRIDSPATAEPDPASPPRLGTAEIKQGIDRLKEQVSACGKAAGVPATQKLRVKFTIEGRTGAVIEEEYIDIDDPELANCVHEVISAMQADGTGVFSRFAAERQSFQFNFLIR